MTRNPEDGSLVASREQVEQALAGLTTVQLLRLGLTAEFRHRSLGARGAGRNPEDLLSDAIIAALEGRRKWPTAIAFMAFLQGAMRSLASHIRAGRMVDAFDDIAPNRASDKEDNEDCVTQIAAPKPTDPERELLARELAEQIQERFKDDPVALLVYEAFVEKMTPGEIQNCLGISEKEYNAAARRLRRATRTITQGRPR